MGYFAKNTSIINLLVVLRPVYRYRLTKPVHSGLRPDILLKINIGDPPN